MPVENKLGSTTEWITRGSKRRIVEKLHTFSYIPILEVLQQMLKNDGIYDEVCLGHSIVTVVT